MTEERQHPLKADILAIDDTPENLALLSQMLREKGYKVRSVTKGSTAIRGAKAGVRSKIVGNLKQAIAKKMKTKKVKLALFLMIDF